MTRHRSRGSRALRSSICAGRVRRTWKWWKHARVTKWCALEKGLIVLEVITGIAPLLGLIGAVSGLVHVFSNLGLSSGASDTRQIALGIAEALNATVFGLSIAVPTLIAFSYFSKKVEVMSVEMETLVVELISKCYYGRSSREVMPTKSPPLESAPTPTPVV